MNDAKAEWHRRFMVACCKASHELGAATRPEIIKGHLTPLIEELATALDEQYIEAERLLGDKERIVQIRQHVIESQSERIKDLEAGYDRSDHDVRNMAWGAERRNLKAKLEAAEKDAARLDWVEDRGCGLVCEPKHGYWTKRRKKDYFFHDLDTDEYAQ